MLGEERQVEGARKTRVILCDLTVSIFVVALLNTNTNK